jgi:N-acetylglucosaminyl-diphospho-decaprenol L-rhamnosyltransferase
VSAPLSIVVAIHDSAADLPRLLDSIGAHLDTPQVIVVDSGSSDAGAELAAARTAEVVVLDGNPGFGAANVAGVERARHDITVLLNPDTALLDGGLERLAEHVRGHDVLAVPRLLNGDGSVQRSAHPVPGGWDALLPAVVHPRALPRRLRERFDPWRAERPRRVGWAIAACLVARTATLRRLGPFDPDTFLFYEDLDLCLRARAAGVPTELHPDVRVVHAGATSTTPHFGGEPFELLARRRREAIAATLGAGAAHRDDAAQALTFATRAAARALLRLPAGRERAQLAALARARRR